MGSSVADDLRELAVALKKIGITPAQCALGSRVTKIMINLGVKENGFEAFILEIYNRCKDLGLTPENIASHLKDLFEFFNNLCYTILADSKVRKTKGR